MADITERKSVSYRIPITPPKCRTFHTDSILKGPSPLKRTLASLQIIGKTKQDDIRPLFRMDVMGNLQNHIEVDNFVEAVWGLKCADLEGFDKWQYIPSAKALREFEAAIEFGEIRMYDPICDLLQDAYQQARVQFKIEYKTTVKFISMGTKQLKTVGNNFFKPDMGAGTTAGLNIYIEGKLNSGTSLKAQPKGYNSTPSQRASKRTATSRSANGRKFRSQTAATHDYPPPVYTPTSSSRNPPALDEQHNARTGSKRKAVSDTILPNKARKASESPLEPIIDALSAEGAEEVKNAINPNPGSKETELTKNEIQLGSYALELLSQIGNRRYATAILVRGRMMSLWYYDRIGVFCTKEFNFMDQGQRPDPKKLALVAVALSLCDRDHFGYEPLLCGPSLTVAPTAVTDAVLVLPAGKVEGRQGEKISNEVSFKVRAEALYMQFGIVGRGTVVLRVLAQEKSGLVPKYFTSKDLIAKLSWPVATRMAEDYLIRLIRSKVPEKWRRHLPDLQCSTTLDKDALSLPRSHEAMKSSLGDSAEWRVLRIMVCARALPLTEIHTLKAFKKVFLDLVRCHYVVYEKAGILHRDLSVNNLMFRLSTRGPFGVLNDWDLSEDVAERKQDTSRKHPAARHRTGTAPFMALELLYDKPPCHLYRHDLESFVWILIWDARSLYRLSSRVGHEETGKISKGHKMNLLIGRREELHKLYAEIHPAFMEIVKSWIVPLVEMLSKVYSAIRARDTSVTLPKPAPAPVVVQEKNLSEMYGDAEVIDDTDGEEDADLPTDNADLPIDNAAIGNQDVQEQNGPWDEETLGGLMTFAKFMAAIGESADIPDL